MYVGRRIYYDKKNGDVLVNTGEHFGFFKKNTVEEDVNVYKKLSERNFDSFDYIDLEYGKYSQDFAESNGYRVNPETKTLEFSYPDQNEPEAPPVFQKPLSEQIVELKTQLTATEQITTENTLAQQELLELLIDMEVL